MKLVVLYSRHEEGNKAKAEALASTLAGQADVIDVADAFDGAVGEAVKLLVGARAFPCVIPVLDCLQDGCPNGIEHAQAIVAALQDLEAQEFHKQTPGYLPGVMALRKAEGRAEIRQKVKAALDGSTTLSELKTKLQAMTSDTATI